jgi:hypothetical protein
MRTTVPALVLSSLLLAANANAGSIITISFDALQTDEDALNYYNGGFGSMGSGPGSSLGVIFSPGWIAGPPDVYLAPGGKSAGLSSTAIMDVPAGWSGLFSFYYSGAPLVVDFYDGLDGAGTLVKTLSLPDSSSVSTLNGFSPAGGDLPLFESAVFRPGASGDRIDALTSGALVIPEPSVFQLSLGGIGLLSLIWPGSISTNRRPRRSRRRRVWC